MTKPPKPRGVSLETEGGVEEEAKERYRRACELAEQVRHEWEEEGRPLTVEWHNGTVSEAPLLRLLREAERDAERFARAIPKPAKQPGRKQVAVVSPSPAAKLRAVG